MTTEEQLAKFKQFGCKNICAFHRKTGKCAYGNKSKCDQFSAFDGFIGTSVQNGFLDIVSTQTLVDALRRRGLTGELRESKIVVI